MRSHTSKETIPRRLSRRTKSQIFQHIHSIYQRESLTEKGNDWTVHTAHTEDLFHVFFAFVFCFVFIQTFQAANCLTYNYPDTHFCLSVAVRQIVWANLSLRYTSMLLGRYATNKQTTRIRFYEWRRKRPGYMCSETNHQDTRLWVVEYLVIDHWARTSVAFYFM